MSLLTYYSNDNSLFALNGFVTQSKWHCMVKDYAKRFSICSKDITDTLDMSGRNVKHGVGGVGSHGWTVRPSVPSVRLQHKNEGTALTPVCSVHTEQPCYAPGQILSRYVREIKKAPKGPFPLQISPSSVFIVCCVHVSGRIFFYCCSEQKWF